MNFKKGDRVIVNANSKFKTIYGIIDSTCSGNNYAVEYEESFFIGFHPAESIELDKQYYREERLNKLLEPNHSKD